MTLIPVIAVLTQAAWITLEWRRGAISGPLLHGRDIALDRHSSTVWDIANALEWLGLFLGFLGVGRFHRHVILCGIIGLILVIGGIWIRWTAVRTLGRLFTGFVAIKSDHRLVTSGIYRIVRHPSYTGLLVAHTGLGLSLASWVSLSMSTIPFVVATFYRMPVEESALRNAFGREYDDYARSTRRLVPWLY